LLVFCVSPSSASSVIFVINFSNYYYNGELIFLKSFGEGSKDISFEPNLPICGYIDITSDSLSKSSPFTALLIPEMLLLLGAKNI